MRGGDRKIAPPDVEDFGVNNKPKKPIPNQGFN